MRSIGQIMTYLAIKYLAIKYLASIKEQHKGKLDVPVLSFGWLRKIKNDNGGDGNMMSPTLNIYYICASDGESLCQWTT